MLSGLAGACLLHVSGRAGPAGRPVVLASPSAACLRRPGRCAAWSTGLGVIGLGLHPFIITLGTMGIFRGIAFVTTKRSRSANFIRHSSTGSSADGCRFGDEIMSIRFRFDPDRRRLWGSLYLAAHGDGRKLHAIGGNERRALCRGCRAAAQGDDVCPRGADGGDRGDDQYRLSRFGVGRRRGYELEVIAAAVVGGSEPSGGRGEPPWGRCWGR